ncbi:hypothetical protein PFLUV_G00230690 [Perca fluviatilis]|uniref:Uncharacterized protein n=1 Tax=Perca fluviatilis TaxID=8168 RepID=A0A6A5EKT1_PERFL|nr:hypothetical protein PFLUV_G00230690 [Perca fluviatilis]
MLFPWLGLRDCLNLIGEFVVVVCTSQTWSPRSALTFTPVVVDLETIAASLGKLEDSTITAGMKDFPPWITLTLHSA